MGSKSNSKSTKGNKQNLARGNSGKLQSQETNVDKEPNGDPHTDLSVLRKPIDISVSGVGQVVKVYQAGTTEVRQLLAYECDLIYECKVCRNLFRSLANFLSHKRVYCREECCDTKHVFPTNHLVEDRTTVIQPESIPPGPCTETWLTNDATPDLTAVDSEDPLSSHVETSIPRITAYSKPKKDLSRVIERLSQQKRVRTVTETLGHISASKFYETVSEQVAAQKDACKEHVIHLEAVENGNFGVFQTVLHSSSTVHLENTDLMKAQVVELHNMMTRNEATLGPDGHVAMVNGEGTTPLAVAPNSDENGVVPFRKQGSAQNNIVGSSKDNHVCSICNTRFSTRKTLSHHMKSLHVTSRMCYPCPCCKNTFCNTWSVYRHLYKVHRKTTIQVRKLRSQIVNKAFRKEVSVYESQNLNKKSAGGDEQTEADKAREEQQRLQQENQAWMNSFEEDLELQMCGGCGRRFERRAALNSHSQICQKRIAVKNNIKAQRRSPSTSASTTNNRITSTKILPTSTDRHLPRTENTRNDITCVESNASSFTPSSVLSESMQSNASGIKSIVTPSPSPVPLDISNQLLASSPSGSYHRTRHCSGSRTDTVKKDIPEKRIEIQIRRDYCKTGIGPGGVSSVLGVGGPSSQQQDCNSEIHENPMSYDDTEEGSNHDEVDNSFSEDCEGHSRLYHLTEPVTCISTKDLHLSCDKVEGSSGINVCHFTESIEKEAVNVEEETIDGANIHPVRTEGNVISDRSSIQSVQDSGLNNANQSEEYSYATEKKGIDTHVSNFRMFIEKNSTTAGQEDESRLRQVFTNSAALSDGGELQDEAKKVMDKQGNESVPSASSKKEEQFSPVMENRMKSMINIRRLQCLPCQKKFNKLTNLRRHVAVHIGWNRYRCTECTFKCFSKYDCVTHVNKMHLGKGEHDRAQTMVEYIETQISDVESESAVHEPTEQTNKSQSDEQDVAQVTNIDLSNNYGVSKDMEITVNDTTCNASDWSLQEYDESKRISTSDSDVSIEAVPNDAQNSVMDVEDAEESDLFACPVEGKTADDVAIDIPVRQDTLITAGGTTDTTTVDEMERDYVNKTVVRDTTDSQAKKASNDTVITTLQLRSRKHFMNDECYGQETSEASPPKKLLTTEYQQNIEKLAVTDVEENDSHNPEMQDVGSEIDTHADPVPASTEGGTLQEENPPMSQVQEQTALRKMVLEVIFGSNNSNLYQDLEATQKLFTVAMNGEHDRSRGSASSPEPYDVVEYVSFDSTSPLTSNSSVESPVLTSDDGASVITEQTSGVKHDSNTSRQNRLGNNMSAARESEKRRRPVRNRIKVEREDFIYDLSDKCLDPRNDGEVHFPHSSKVTKRKQEDRTRDSVKTVSDKGNCSGESSPLKLIPKLILVRTTGEFSGVKVVKTGNNSNVTQVLDSSNDKNNSSDSTGYSRSTRKSQRTFDASPYKVQTVDNEGSE